MLPQRDIEDGDEIAVFTDGGVCGGASIIELEGNYLDQVGVAAWKDDEFTEEIDGFTTGEEIFFRYWDDSEEEEIELGIHAVTQGSTIWSINSVHIVHLSEPGAYYKTIPTSLVHRIVCSDFSLFINPDGTEGAPGGLDQIGVFTPEGIVAGIMIWDGDQAGCFGWAFGDDPQTEEIEGFREGDVFSFKLWRADVEEEIEAVIKNISGNEDFIADLDSYTEVQLRAGDYTVSDDPIPPARFDLIGLSPNPFNGTSKLYYTMNSNSVVLLSVFDIYGRKVLSRNMGMKQKGVNQVPIELNIYPAGSYYFQIATEQEVWTTQGTLMK
ncbi:T9SS type A sorting domain-containing protein [Calditrichota bacterium]